MKTLRKTLNKKDISDIKEITNIISRNNNIPKKEIYNYCLKIKNEK